MGSVKATKNTKYPRRALGKIDAHLTQKLQNVKWAEFLIGDLFEKIKVNSLKYKTTDLPSKPKGEYTLPALTAGIQNQGLNNYVPTKGATILKNVISISANGANTGATFYQNKEFTVLQDSYAIKWIYSNKKLTNKHYLYIVSAISKAIYGNFEWTNKAGWEKVKKEKITLPTHNGAIDFTFMETFIAELEAQRVVELEVQRKTELEAYLAVTGLKDYTLTKEEEKALNSLDKVQWRDFTIGDLFEIATGRDVIIRDVQQGNIPLISHQHENNGITKYIKPLKDRTLFNHQTTISLADRGVFYATNQNEDFHIGTRVKALSFKQGRISKKVRLFLVSAINKLQVLFTEYSQNATDKLPFLKITLPTKNGTPDYDFMNTYIKAIHKLVIKEVVLYAEKKIQATQEAIK